MYGTIHHLINVLVHTYGYNIKNVQKTWYDSHRSTTVVTQLTINNKNIVLILYGEYGVCTE